jgi:hypothetical protein
MLVEAEAQDQRAARPCSDDDAWFAGANDGNGKSAAQSLDGQANGCEQIIALHHELVHQVHHDLRVCIGIECVTGSLQLLAQGVVVLDDPVVHQRDGFARQVRVCVGRVGHAMRCPACVGDSAVTRQRRLLEQRFEIPDLALGAQALDRSIGL